MRVAVAAGETELAAELLEPVLRAPSGIVSNAVAANLLNLRGVVAALRGDDPAEVERDLRAGLAALTEFGAVGWAARAAEDLGRWLVGQGRIGEASRSLEHAAQTYQEIGALGWLAELERWQSAHVPESVS